MNKDVRPESKVVGAENVSTPVKTAPSVLDQSILDAINAAVVGSVKAIVEQLKPIQAAAQPRNEAKYPTPYVPPYEPYKSKLTGIPVEPGQDLRHVHPQIIVNWFNAIEKRAQERLKSQGMKNGLQTQMTLSRG